MPFVQEYSKVLYKIYCETDDDDNDDDDGEFDDEEEREDDEALLLKYSVHISKSKEK